MSFFWSYFFNSYWQPVPVDSGKLFNFLKDAEMLKGKQVNDAEILAL